MFVLAVTPASLLRRFVSVLLLSLLVVGCSGGNTYSVDRGRIAQHYLPTEQTVPNHPDSLQALTITEEDGKIQYHIEQDYESIIRKWSSGFRNVGPGRTRRTRTYATLWSLELALLSLQPEVGILSLQSERAQGFIEDRRREYFDTIHIDVYWFVGRSMNGIITGSGARTRLRVRDTTYRPIRADHGPLREAYVDAGETALYRRNSLYFPRTVDGTDVLKNASGIRLEVRRSGWSSTERFAWVWDEDQTAQYMEGPLRDSSAVFSSR